MTRPDVFISATSRDLAPVRKSVRESLLVMGCHPIEQDSFPPDYRKVIEMLEDKISSCEAVIHIVGMRYGAEPKYDSLPEGNKRRSYTQLEADIAKNQGKKLYLFICGEEFPYEQADPEQPELRSNQIAYRESLAKGHTAYTRVDDVEDLSVKVKELQLELDALKKAVHKERRWNASVLAAILFALIALVSLGLLLTEKNNEQSDSLARMEVKLDATLRFFAKERQLLTEILEASLRKSTEMVQLTAEESYDKAVEEIATKNSMTEGELVQIMEGYATQVRDMGPEASALDRSLIAQKEQRFSEAGKIAASGLDEMERKLAILKENLVLERASDSDIENKMAQLKAIRVLLLMVQVRSDLFIQKELDRAIVAKQNQAEETGNASEEQAQASVDKVITAADSKPVKEKSDKEWVLNKEEHEELVKFMIFKRAMDRSQNNIPNFDISKMWKGKKIDQTKEVSMIEWTASQNKVIEKTAVKVALTNDRLISALNAGNSPSALKAIADEGKQNYINAEKHAISQIPLGSLRRKK